MPSSELLLVLLVLLALLSAGITVLVGCGAVDCGGCVSGQASACVVGCVWGHAGHPNPARLWYLQHTTGVKLRCTGCKTCVWLGAGTKGARSKTHLKPRCCAIMKRGER